MMQIRPDLPPGKKASDQICRREKKHLPPGKKADLPPGKKACCGRTQERVREG
jgi:hypothetical protein